MKRWVALMVCLFLAAVAMPLPALAASVPAIMIGRVYYIEGDLLRYVPEEKDWVAMVKDAPFGTEDTLFSGNRGMAEMIVPNGTWIRVGIGTQIQFISLGGDMSEIDVAAGMARFYNKGTDTVIKATSPFGYVLAYPGAVFDFYVGENSVEVVAVKGKVSFVHGSTDVRYDVSAGSPSILADENQVSSGEGTVDPDWNRWNMTRENFWAAKARVRGRSVQYLPTDLESEAYALEENGRWESVPYEGSSRWFWRPTTIAVGWSPFTTGRWTDWNGDQVWIPAEPFGYVTHHYGNWVSIRNRWYWAPPVAAVRIGLPLLDIGFFWSPGRVTWIHSGAYVGWVPLAPRETYYSHRNWGGPHEVVITNVNVTKITINIGSYAYANRAIVVPRSSFYGVNSYGNVRVKNINPVTIVNNYRAAPVVNNTVINNYTTNKERHNFTNIAVKEKPHDTVINRIEKNAPIEKRDRKESAASVQEQVKSTKEGKINRDTHVEAPKTTNYIVPTNEANRPKSEIKLPQKEIRKSGAGARIPPEVVGKPRSAPVEPGQSVAKPQSLSPVKPVEKGKPVEQPARVAPARPGQEERPRQVVVPRYVAPARPGQSRQVVVPEHVAPTKQELPGQVVVPEHMAPARPGKPIRVVVPEHVTPVKPNQPELPGQVVVPRHTAPAKLGQPKQVVIPEHVMPVQKPDRVIPAKTEGPPEQAMPERSSEKETPVVRPDEKDSKAVKPDRGAPAKSERQERTQDKPVRQERPR